MMALNDSSGNSIFCQLDPFRLAPLYRLPFLFPIFVKYMKKQIKIILLHEKTNQNNCFANYFGALLMAKVEHNSNNGIYTYIKTLESHFKNQLVGIKNIIWIVECEKITYVFYSFPHKIVSAHTHKTTNKSWPILMKSTKYWEIYQKQMSKVKVKTYRFKCTKLWCRLKSIIPFSATFFHIQYEKSAIFNYTISNFHY